MQTHQIFSIPTIPLQNKDFPNPSTMVTESNNQDRTQLLKAFDETKAGVKGLVDSGITKLPQIFINPLNTDEYPHSSSVAKIPTIDLSGALGFDPLLRKGVVEKISEAAETYGFFQVINHGIHVDLLQEMIDGGRRFFEQDLETKKKYFTRDYAKSVVYNSNYDLYTSKSVNWRDTLNCVMIPPPKDEEIPLACREILLKYNKAVMELAQIVLELLSEALDLPRNYLKEIGCAEGHSILFHYSPKCPEPEKTIGNPKHTDTSFITLLLQDQIGGLQVAHDHQWFDVTPVPGALVVNIGDLLQLLSNAKFKSVEHRVVPNGVGARMSLASFFNGTRLQPNPRLYGPIKELVSETNPAKYRETTLRDFLLVAYAKGTDGTSPLKFLRV